jgi:hypothetical protein
MLHWLKRLSDVDTYFWPFSFSFSFFYLVTAR